MNCNSLIFFWSQEASSGFTIADKNKVTFFFYYSELEFVIERACCCGTW